MSLLIASMKLSVGLWIDGTSLGSANGGASRALLQIYLQKMNAPPHQMIGAIVIGEVIFLNDELPNKLNGPHARSEELAEEPCLR